MRRDKDWVSRSVGLGSLTPRHVGLGMRMGGDPGLHDPWKIHPAYPNAAGSVDAQIPGFAAKRWER